MWSDFNRSMHQITFSEAAPVDDSEIARMYDEATDNHRYENFGTKFNYRDYIRKSLKSIDVEAAGAGDYSPGFRDPSGDFGRMFVSDPKTARDRNQRYGFLAGVDFKRKSILFLRREARSIIKKAEETSGESVPRISRERNMLLARLFVKLCNLAEVRNEVWKKPFISYVFGEKTGSVFFTPLMNLRWDGSPREIRSFDDARDFAETVMAPENTGFPMFNIREIHSGFMECLILNALTVLLLPETYDRAGAEGLIASCLRHFGRPRNRGELLGMETEWIRSRGLAGICLADLYFLSEMASGENSRAGKLRFYQEFRAAGIKMLGMMRYPRIPELESPEFRNFRECAGLFYGGNGFRGTGGQEAGRDANRASIFGKNIAGFSDWVLVQSFIDAGARYLGIPDTQESGVNGVREECAGLEVTDPELYISPRIRVMMGETLGIPGIGKVRFSEANACIFREDERFFLVYFVPERSSAMSDAPDSPEKSAGAFGPAAGTVQIRYFRDREYALEYLRGLLS